MKTRRGTIAIIDCEDAPKWHDHVALWTRPLATAGLESQTFRAFAGEFPEARASSVLITGSHYSVNDAAVPWLGALFEHIRVLVASGARVYGTCFGAQAIAVALGGKVTANASGRFIFGAERVQGLLNRGGWTVLQSHGEYVAELPAGASVLADSVSCPHEIFRVGPRVLGVQGHPEMTTALLLERILPALVENQRLDRSEVDEGRRSLETWGALDGGAILEGVTRFLSWRAHGIG